MRYPLGDVGPVGPDLLRRHVPDLLDRDVHLPASARPATAVRQAPREAGLPDRQLHEERFAP